MHSPHASILICLAVFVFLRLSAEAGGRPEIKRTRAEVTRTVTTGGVPDTTSLGLQVQENSTPNGKVEAFTVTSQNNSSFTANAQVILDNATSTWRLLTEMVRADTSTDTPPDQQAPGTPTFTADASAQINDLVTINLRSGLQAIAQARIEFEFSFVADGPPQETNPGPIARASCNASYSVGLGGGDSRLRSGTPDSPGDFDGSLHIFTLTQTRLMLPTPTPGQPTFTQGQILINAGVSARAWVQEYYQGDANVTMLLSEQTGLRLRAIRVFDNATGILLSPDFFVFASRSGFDYAKLARRQITQFADSLSRKTGSSRFEGRIDWSVAKSYYDQALDYLTAAVLPASGSSPAPRERGTDGDSYRFSGTLGVGKNRRVFKGTFDATGLAHFEPSGTTTMRFPQKGGQPDIILGPLQLDSSTVLGRITGGIAIDGGGPTGQIDLLRGVYTAVKDPPLPFNNPPASLLGPFTVSLPARTPAQVGLSASAFPQAAGIARLTVNRSGFAKLAGRLADGTAFSASAGLTEGDEVHWNALLYAGAGGFSGAATFRNQAASDVDGTDLTWGRPAIPGTFYPQGWPGGIGIDLAGARYTLPPRTPAASVFSGLTVAAPAVNARLALTGGGLPDADPGDADPATPWQVDLSINAKNGIAIAAPAPLGLSATIKKSTGQLTGKFRALGATRVTKFQSTILQKAAQAAGYFTGVSESGSVTVVAVP